MIPLTVADTDPEKGTVAIIFQIVGATTEKLNHLKQGEALQDFVGPLGRPTELEGLKKVAVIGGGVALKRGIVVYALPIGMVTTVVFVLSIVARFLSWTQIADTLLWISVALSMVALIWYAVDLMKKLGIKADSTK